MFQSLQAQPSDPLLALIKAYEDDLRMQKIDLGVVVYRDEDGKTPVMAAIKEAEALLMEQQDTKAYLGPGGDAGFESAIARLICGDYAQSCAWVGLQIPGGKGALRVVNCI